MIENSFPVQIDEQAAIKWLASKEWSNGITIAAHSTVNPIEFYTQYHANKMLWDKLFVFLKDNDLGTLSPGKYEIDGDNAFAFITEAVNKDIDDCIWESHLKYIDLQYIIKGKETIGVAAESACTIIKPYDDAKDVIIYTAEGAYYTVSPDTFFLFFPQDVHRPCIKAEGFDEVKKVVIKIIRSN